MIPDIVTYALILWIWGMVLTVFGSAAAVCPSAPHSRSSPAKSGSGRAVASTG